MGKIHLIGTRTRDLPACSIVPQPTTLPRTPVLWRVSNYLWCFLNYLSVSVSYANWTANTEFLTSASHPCLPGGREDCFFGDWVAVLMRQRLPGVHVWNRRRMYQEQLKKFVALETLNLCVKSGIIMTVTVVYTGQWRCEVKKMWIYTLTPHTPSWRSA
jgi:hypothetical protein